MVAVSPVRPNLAAVGANTGLAFMTFDRMYPLPVAGLPLSNLAAAHDSPALRLPRDPVAAAYVAHLGDAVWLVNCTAVEKVRGVWASGARGWGQGERVLSCRAAPAVIDRVQTTSCCCYLCRPLQGPPQQLPAACCSLVLCACVSVCRMWVVMWCRWCLWCCPASTWDLQWGAPGAPLWV